MARRQLLVAVQREALVIGLAEKTRQVLRPVVVGVEAVLRGHLLLAHDAPAVAELLHEESQALEEALLHGVVGRVQDQDPGEALPGEQLVLRLPPAAGIVEENGGRVGGQRVESRRPRQSSARPPAGAGTASSRAAGAGQAAQGRNRPSPGTGRSAAGPAERPARRRRSDSRRRPPGARSPGARLQAGLQAAQIGPVDRTVQLVLQLDAPGAPRLPGFQGNLEGPGSQDEPANPGSESSRARRRDGRRQRPG